MFPLLVPVSSSQFEQLTLPEEDFMFKDTYISFNKKLKSTTSFKTQPKKQKHVAILWWIDPMTMVSQSPLWQILEVFEMYF